MTATLFRHLNEWTRIQVFHDNNRDFKSRTFFVGGERCPVALFKSLLQEAKTKWNNENLSAEKMQRLYLINTLPGSFQHHNNCVSTHPSMAASKENKLPPSFLGCKSQKFLHESCCDGVSGTDHDEQPLNNSASAYYLWLLEAFSWFQNGSIRLVNAELS